MSMMPLERSGNFTVGMPAASEPAGTNEFAGLYSSEITAGYGLRIGRLSGYGSLVMPNPARKTVLSVARYANPTRGAHITSAASEPASRGTLPRPPIRTLLVSGSQRSMPY